MLWRGEKWRISLRTGGFLDTGYKWSQIDDGVRAAIERDWKTLQSEWDKLYGHGVYFAETFVDTTRHRGTCYRAANWIFMGRTTGRGKNDLTHRPNRTVKDVLGFPLRKDFRKQLLETC